jgi:hypothetical protein
VRGRPESGIGNGDLFLVGLQIGNQFLHAGNRHVVPDEQGHRHVGHLADRLEVLQRIERQPLVERRRSRHADMHQQHGVAVRRRAHDLVAADRAAGAGCILDHHGLLEIALELLGEQARHRVGRPSRGERNDHRDRFRGKFLRDARCRQHAHRKPEPAGGH